MKTRLDGVRATRAVLVASFTLGVCAAAPASARQDQDGRAEDIPLVDPYTRGAPEVLDRAGYVSLGPFPWMAGVRTEDVEKTLGERRVLWIETAHFKLGSTLATYRTAADKREDKKLRAELERLAKKLDHLEPEKNRLDPWLRLHLFAQRLEDQYAEFLKRFGFDDQDFLPAREPAPSGSPSMGSGPYLGMDMKPTVLLTEKTSTLGRFLRYYSNQAEACTWRGRLEGGTMFLGQSAECVRQYGYELDAALQCAVAANLAFNLVDGFRKNHNSSPVWFKCGLASWFSRRIDERWTIYARGTTFTFDDDSWKWAPRVRGLVAHDLAIPWSRMLEWTSWEEIDAPGHMVLWSRVDWLLSRKDADLRAFLMGMTESLVYVPALARARVSRERQEDSLRAGFGGTPAELDTQWKEFVLKNTPKK